MPSIEFTDEGKPYFTKNSNIPCPVFSISHDRDFAAVAISDENINLGVDIQSMPENKGRLERIAQRFLEVFRRSDSVYKKLMMESEMKRSRTREHISHLFLYLDESFDILESDEGKIGEIIFGKEEKEYEYLTKWTALEASLKMSGGGFADYNDAENIINDASIYNFIFSTKEKIDYSISISYI